MSKEIPHAPRRKPYVLPGGQDPSNDTFNISEEDMPDDYKKAISDAYAYKVQLEKKMVGFAEDTVFTDSEYTSDESTGKHKREEFYEGEKRPKARPPPRPRRGKASVALSDIRRNIEQKKALKEKKRREKLGIIRKGYCSRKLFVDETDLEDLSFFDAENIEKGEIRSKRFPKDYALDRLMDISPAYTGMCRDCWKRADYIVVFCATGDDLYADELKVGFLSTLVKIGFDLEIERGVMPEHNNLLFCKIHATDPLLADYKDHFEISKYFQDNHVHMIGKKGMKPYWTDYFRPVHEREWVKMMRRRYIKPLRLSNRDRSYITYMIVCHQPFGIRDKYYGMYRLLKKKILIDGFALHDGPYFITADQLACNANGRQILFHNWAGFSNMFMSQPLSVINEYYGPKLACFFAFYQFFLWMMLLMIPISIFVLLPAWRFLKNLFVGEGSNMYCEAAKLAVRHLCPTCMDFNACPLRNLSDYCEVHKFVRLTQRIMILSPIFTTWCVFFFFCWKRKQNYWRWLWEIRPKPRHPIVRVEYELKYQTAKRSRLTGIWTFRSTYKRILERIAAPFIVTLAIAIPFLGTITIYYYNVRILRNTSFLMKGIIKNNTKMLKYRDYIALGIALPVFFVGSVIFELIFARLSELMTKWENHRFVKNYERSLTYRYFAVSLIYTFPCMIFVSWIKGRFFAHPLEHWRTVVNITTSFFHINKSMPFLGHFLYFHCNKTINCIDEMVFTFFLFIIFMTTTLAFKHFFRLFPRILKWAVTDFNLSREKEYNAPEWEREYKLKPLHDNTVLQWTNQVVIQLAFFVWFGNIAPYLSIIVFFANLAFVRVLGKQLVRYYRRPTLHNCRGLGTYNKVINFVLLASPLAHAFNNSRMDIFWKNTFLTKNFSLINESRNAYINMPWQYKMNVCLYPTKFRHYYPLAELTLPWPYHWLNISNNVTQLVASHNRYIVEMNKAADIIKYTHSFLLFIVMLFMYFPSKNKFVQERSMKEDEIKRYAIHEEFIFNDDEHGDIIQ